MLIDTNVAIALRDGDAATEMAVASLGSSPALSQITHIELEGGVYRDPRHAPVRRALTDRLVASLRVLELLQDDVLAYGRIVGVCGFDRRRILDRLIAAQALTRQASLITRNAADFRDVPGLILIAW